jgi:aspartate carbamoyltransferase catalytic subunit
MAVVEVGMHTFGNRNYVPEIIHPGSNPSHIIEAQQFDPKWLLEDLFPLTHWMEGQAKTGPKRIAQGKRGYNLFYQASTRTRTSFESAIDMLGGTFSSTENARAFSSASKGETLEDTIRILNGYAYDYIVLRHDKEGGALRAARNSNIPIINAGDGIGQHPTQALLDVYTIHEQLGQLRDLNLTMIGDLDRGRTVHSLAYIMAQFPGVHMNFISSDNLRIPEGLRQYLERHDVSFKENDNLRSVLGETDVAYVTRLQKEMPTNNGEANTKQPVNVNYQDFSIDLEALSYMKPDTRVLHPLPRNEELPIEVDSDPRVIVFRQAQNGLYVRMAVLDMLLSRKKDVGKFTLYMDGIMPKVRTLTPFTDGKKQAA